MEVKIDILQAISEGIGRPTHIMYRSNLSWASMRHFIKFLEDQGLVSPVYEEGRKNYTLTQKGVRVVDAYANVRVQLNSLQLIAPLV